MQAIRQREVLHAVLLETLASKPDGMLVSEVNEAISEDYQFPEEWYRELPESSGYAELERLGYDDWRSVPQSMLVELVKTEPQWRNEIRWARNDLRKLGLLDTSAPRGTWRLNAEGLEAAKNPATRFQLNEQEREVATPKPRKRRPQPVKSAPSATPEGAVTERERLMGTLTQLANGLVLGELELLVDMARLIRKRSLVEEKPAD